MLIQSYVVTATVPADNETLLGRLSQSTMDADLVTMTIGEPDADNKVLVTITYKGDKTPAADVRMAALGCVKLLGRPNGADNITCHIEYRRITREERRALGPAHRRMGERPDRPQRGERPARPERPTRPEAQ